MSPQQSTPVCFDKFKRIVFHSLVLSKSISPSDRYIYARDLAFFALSGGRPSDLGRIKATDVLSYPDGSLEHPLVS